MLEPPNIAGELLVVTLQQAYHLPLSAIHFLPVGNDASAWIFRVDTIGIEDNATYLFKLKQGAVDPTTLTIPHHLSTHGMAAVVAPLPTATGQLATSCGDFTLILYPFITGDTGMVLGLSATQWRNFGTLLQQLHTTALPADLTRQLPRESFLLCWHETMKTLDHRIHSLDATDPIAHALAAIWQDRRSEIWAIVERTIALGKELHAAPPPFVLCHADIHTANVLVDQQGTLHIVDWDGVMLAPKERDLMFVMARATVLHSTEAQFFTGYGPTTIDPIAFAYYRYAWVVQELADYGRRILFLDDVGTATKMDALQGFEELFAPGNVVDVAYGTEADLPL